MERLASYPGFPLFAERGYGETMTHMSVIGRQRVKGNRSIYNSGSLSKIIIRSE